MKDLNRIPDAFLDELLALVRKTLTGTALLIIDEVLRRAEAKAFKAGMKSVISSEPGSPPAGEG